MKSLHRCLPILDWGRRYDRAALSSDLVAALLPAIMISVIGLQVAPLECKNIRQALIFY
ncbi:MAG: hypothetical protein ACK5LJ_03850 [Paracoccus sp. (in: a-proteobacteria)]